MSNIFLANIRVVLKETVSDPQGATIMAGLKTLGFDSVQDLRAGKFLQVIITATTLNLHGSKSLRCVINYWPIP